MKLFNLFKGLNPRQVIIGSQKPYIFGTAPVSSYSKEKSVQEGYASNADVYSIINLLARKAASIPWYVYRKKEGTKARVSFERYKQLSKGIATSGAFDRAVIERSKALNDEIISDSPLARLMMQPNPNQGQDSFFENLYGFRFLTGEGFIWGNDGGSDSDNAPFVEMYVLPSQLMEHYPDPNDIFAIAGWKLMFGTGMNLPKSDVLQWRTWNPKGDVYTRDYLRGFSPLEAAYKTLLMANESETASFSMMKNGGAKGALVPDSVNGIMQELTPEQAAMVKNHVNDNVNKAINKGNIDVFQTPWKYLDFGLSSVDMQLIDTQKVTLEKLCRVFGVPSILFNADASSYNNYQNALRDLVTNTIVPAISSLRDEMNRWLIGRNGNDQEYIDFDIQALPELQSDIAKLVQGLSQANWLTYDEKRIATGYEPKGGAFDEAYVPGGLVPLGEISMSQSLTDDNLLDDIDI
jgi:HK97 family phage portal protein